MLIIVAALLVLSVVALIVALVVGAAGPAHPRHGTFGVDGLDGSFFAWGCVGLCVIGLLLLFVDVRRGRRHPAPPDGQEHHTAGEDLFAEHDVERDLTREN